MYGSECILLMADTDSFLYEIRNAKSDFSLDRNVYVLDTSDYHSDHFLHSNSKKETVGKFKDEPHGKPIEAFCGLSSKLYVCLLVGWLVGFLFFFSFFFFFVFCCCYDLVNTIKVMSSRSVNLITLLLARLRPPKRLNRSNGTSFHQLLITAFLESVEGGEENSRRNYFMINLHERYVAGLWFELCSQVRCRCYIKFWPRWKLTLGLMIKCWKTDLVHSSTLNFDPGVSFIITLNYDPQG